MLRGPQRSWAPLPLRVPLRRAAPTHRPLLSSELALLACRPSVSSPPRAVRLAAAASNEDRIIVETAEGPVVFRCDAAVSTLQQLRDFCQQQQLSASSLALRLPNGVDVVLSGDGARTLESVGVGDGSAVAARAREPRAERSSRLYNVLVGATRNALGFLFLAASIVVGLFAVANSMSRGLPLVGRDTVSSLISPQQSYLRGPP